ncbi:MAG TPA: NUDIX domain-containing protein [Candidatus Bathyarchaeia archaeon]|nr:NUDIX domain-containing protein [Candidatus Bathyarchaeia archaeon]
MKIRYIVCGIIQNGTKIVLGKKAKGEFPYPDVWHTAGGGAEDIKLAKRLYEVGDYDNKYFHSELRRELKEELNIEVTNIKCIVPQYRSQVRQDKTENKKRVMTHYYFLEYLCDYAGGELRPGDDLAEAEWFEKSKLVLVRLTPPSKDLYRELGWIKGKCLLESLIF